MKEMIDLKQIPENVIIPSPEKLEALLKVFKEQGKDKIHVLADFDRTLTAAFVNGQKTPSIISVLRDGSYLSEAYALKAHELFNHYNAIEIDSKIARTEKKKAMDEWWHKHTELLVAEGLTKSDLERVVKSGKIKFRPEADKFFKVLAQENIPVVIMSASGIGDFSIRGMLEANELMSDNIQIISNSMEFDESGRVTKFNRPFIHSLNKDETIIKDFPDVFKFVKDRRNVILLGDNIEDIDMITGFDYDHLIKIGFLNEDIDKNLEAYKRNFDVVIANDGDINFINQLIAEIL
jgi:5'-nucleotidase